MQDASQITLKNRTGMQRSPNQARDLMSSTVEEPPAATPLADAREDALATVRATYIADSGPLGTIPAPLSATGMLKSAAHMLTGDRMQVFMDKLAERAAFERGGTRLYDALLVKHRTEQSSGRNDGGHTPISREALLEIRNQEAEHYHLITSCVSRLGGDPTAVTPAADVVSVQNLGLFQVVADPRTSLVQSLSAVLTAELVDVASWELLEELAVAMRQEEMAERFRSALAHEQRHLEMVQGWYRSLVMAESGNPVGASMIIARETPDAANRARVD